MIATPVRPPGLIADLFRAGPAGDHLLARLRQLYAARAGAGQQVLGIFCSYVPEELLLAAGFVPMRLLEVAGPWPLGDAHLQSYACAAVRSALQALLDGRLDFTAGLVLGHTCDAQQCLGDIVRLLRSERFIHFFMMPGHLRGRGVWPYLLDELARLRQRLAELGGQPIDDGALFAAIAVCNRLRLALRTLYAARRLRPRSLLASDVLAASLAAHLLPSAEVAAAVEDWVGRAGAVAAADDAGGPRILVAGGIVSQPELLGMVEEAGGLVVDDDLCVGSRAFEVDAEVAGGDDPLAAVARRLLGRPPCPSKHGGPSRLARLLARARAARARGVLFLLPKFCETHAFDYPGLRAGLQQAGVANLLVETPADLSRGQLLTRLESFVGMLR